MIRKLIALLLLLALWAPEEARAQEVRKVDGDKYIVHEVEQGETLFGLSRHYAVSLKDLEEANPAAAQGLSIGQVILVPMKAQSRRELRNAPELGEGELLHTVAKRETIYGIAKKYGVTMDQLHAWNPELQYGLQVGMVLRVELGTSSAAPPRAVEPATEDHDRFHLVEPGETLFSLGQRYGLDPERIKEANGGLADGLKAGTYLRIPEPGPKDMADMEPASDADTTRSIAEAAHRKVAILLPFTDRGANAEESYSVVTEAAMAFRAGMAIALDTLAAMGLNAEVHVFDTGVEPEHWQRLFRSDSIRGMDMYIGPFHRAAVEELTRVSGAAPIICPVPQSNKVVLGHPTVSKAWGSRTDRLMLMARYIAYLHAGDNVILLKPDVPQERDLQALMTRELEQALQTRSNRMRDSLLVVPCRRNDLSKAIAELSRTRNNVVVVPSEDVEFVTAVLNQLSAKVPKYNIRVYGMKNWGGIRAVEVEDLLKLNVHVPANAFLDMESRKVNDFIAAYRKRFNNEPDEYAFMGYDVSRYFLQALLWFGDDFPMHYAEVPPHSIYLDFHMRRLGPENGWSNASAVMLRYGPEGLTRAR